MGFYRLCRGLRRRGHAPILPLVTNSHKAKGITAKITSTDQMILRVDNHLPPMVGSWCPSPVTQTKQSAETAGQGSRGG